MNKIDINARPVFVIFDRNGNQVSIGGCHRWCAEWGGWEIVKEIILPGKHWVCGQCGGKLQ